MYICPKCKSDLELNNCTKCDFSIQWKDNIPVFFTDSTLSKRYEEIGVFYDDLYGQGDNVWSNLAARGHEFVEFVSSLVMVGQPVRYLDIGCGEGYQLAAVDASEKFGIDISRKAVQTAGCRSGANLCVAFSEELPYRTAYFDTITSIGVMTHFIDDHAAMSEICRVLRPGGCYVVGLFISPSFTERIMGKVSEFVYPWPKPISFVRWMIRKSLRKLRVVRHPHVQRKECQPVERFYTCKEVEGIFKRFGFVISEVITKRKNPNTPLAGHHFRIYILLKKKNGTHKEV